LEFEMSGFVFDERYAEAVLHVPGGHRVLGVRLRPFSAWHRTVLEYVDSPVMTGGEVGPADLRLAVEVCRRGFPDMPCAPRGLWARLCAESRAMKDARNRRFAQERAAFSAYLGDYVSMPVIMCNGGKGKVESAVIPDIDQTLMDVAVYRFYTGCPRNEPWDLPIGELGWMNAAIARTQGVQLSVVTTEEEERLRKRKAESGERKE
jgi:hypothetical protein